jgi:hypothetical protein
MSTIASRVFGVITRCSNTIKLKTVLSYSNGKNSKDGTPISSDKQSLTQQELLNVFLMVYIRRKKSLKKLSKEPNKMQMVM